MFIHKKENNSFISHAQKTISFRTHVFSHTIH